jgi:hypothetical protein
LLQQADPFQGADIAVDSLVVSPKLAREGRNRQMRPVPHEPNELDPFRG